MGASLTIRAAEWSPELSVLLARGVHDSLVTVESVRALVKSGRGHLFAVLDDAGGLVGAFVLQSNYCECGSELVMACASADLPGYGTFTRSIMPWVEQRAREFGFDRVRVGVGRRGMRRLLKGLDYSSLSETFIKVLR